jgi:hypothetical protein
MGHKAMNDPASSRDEMDAHYRPDEKPEGKADDNARLRGSHQRVRGLKKAGRKHRKSRRK